MKYIKLMLLLISISSISAQTINIVDSSEEYDDVKNKSVNISGKSELHLNGSDPINGATFTLTGSDIWVYLHGEKPSYLKSKLSQFTVNGSVAVDDDNVRVHQYEMGVVLISQDNNYIGATLYSQPSLNGESMDIKHHTIYKSTSGLGNMNNAVSSFVLRRGYMMTIAQQYNGMGYSKNYVADKADITVNALPEALNNQVSFVRVVRWNWPTKKGINSTLVGDSIDASWYYNWGSGSQSLDDIEFVPMKWGGGNVNENNFINKKNITHQLAFNEPSHDEQSNMTVDAALREYPKLLATGLRAGSPNIADNGKPWLYAFMEKADELNYRVDFVGVHWYKGCQTAKQFYTWLKDVYDKTGRPIWITEFNNGAAWTAENCIPTYEEQASKMASFLEMFDTTQFIERYCIYNWGVETRILANLNEDKSVNYLYPSGIVYRDQPSPFAYNEAAYYTPIYVEIPAPTSLSAVKGDNDALTLTWYDNAYQEDGFSIERSFEGGAYEEIGTVEGEKEYKVTYTDASRTEYGEYSYRVRTKKGDNYSAYSDVITSTIDDGIYDIVYIQHSESGKKLRALDWSIEMVDASETGTDVQWVVIPADEGFSHVQSMALPRRLGNGDAGPNLIDSKWSGANTQWELGDAGDGSFYLTNKARGQRLFTKSDNLAITFVPTNYLGTKVRWIFVPTGLKYGETGVDKPITSKYSVYPNPTSNKVFIRGLAQLSEVNVLDVSGRIVKSVITKSELEVSNLKAGIYFIQVDKKETTRFIKR